MFYLYGLAYFLWCLSPSDESLVVRKTPTCSPSCYNGGVCWNNTCLCKPGWGGTHCEFCEGRMVLDQSSGVVSSGVGNYSEASRCMFLVDGLQHDARRIMFSVKRFVTECNWDHLYLFYGDSIYEPTHIGLSGLIDGSTDLMDFTVDSPRATLFFYSDTAFNTSGFNITFTFDSCKTDCGKHGACQDDDTNTCKCNSGWAGENCAIRKCNRKRCKNGKCGKNEVCVCNSGFRGSACRLTKKDLVFEVVSDLDILDGSYASHSAVVYDDAIVTLGGYSIADMASTDHFMRVRAFDFETQTWSILDDGDEAPSPRYDMSAVVYRDSIYIFGGVTAGKSITNEFWRYNSVDGWSLLSGGSDELRDNNQTFTYPLSVAGHSAHVVSNFMLVFSGYSGFLGYVSVIQQYDFTTDTWSLVQTEGASYNGTYGHASALDPHLDVIYVHGGYRSTSQTTGSMINRLYSYHIHQKRWTLLASTPHSLFKHAAVFMNGLLFVFGGNSYNSEHPHDMKACYKNNLLAYDPDCDRWYNIESELVDKASRYGHSMTTHDGAAYVYGGFNGMMLSDMIHIQPCECSAFDSQVDCEHSLFAAGCKCLWLNSRCTPPISPSVTKDGEQKKAVMHRCASAGALPISSDDSCYTFSDCFTCVYNSRNCTWNSGNCVPSLRQEDGAICDDVGSSCVHHRHCTPCMSDPQCAWRRDRQASRPYYGACVRKEDFKDFAYDKLLRHINRYRSSQLATNYEASAPYHVLEHDPASEWHSGSGSAQPPSSDRKGLMQLLAGMPRSAIEGFLRGENFFNVTTVNVPLLFPVEDESSIDVGSCALPCIDHSDCESCLQTGCMWCDNLRSCVNMDVYMPMFGVYGQCLHWDTAASGCSGASSCDQHQTCDACITAGFGCGWCDDGSNTGTGKCVSGGYDGQISIPQAVFHNASTTIAPPDTCPKKQWYFIDCPPCQCNGHGECKNETALFKTDPALPFHSRKQYKCDCCRDRTTGNHCERCIEGYYGNVLNGGNCTACECNGHADSCDTSSGSCYCKTKGIIGAKCDRCDDTAQYDGRPLNGTCYYNLNVDFVFTFQLSHDEDRNITGINFLTRPSKSSADVSFELECTLPHRGARRVPRVDLIVQSDGYPTKKLLTNHPCSTIQRQFDKHEYNIGNDNTTFYVYISNITAPVVIRISFAQASEIDWIKFLTTFASCFVSLLLFSAVLWKIKLRVDQYRRRQRMFVEMAQMASRPFACAQLDLSHSLPVRLQGAVLSVEPCSSYRAGVLSMAVRLPSGGLGRSPPGQAGLAVGSALVYLPSTQATVLQAPPSPSPSKQKRSDRFAQLRRRMDLTRLGPLFA